MMLIDQIELSVRELISGPFPNDADAVDLAGRVNKVSQTLAGYKRSLLSEIPGPVNGSAYRLAVGNKGDRSYNTAPILGDFARAGWTIQDLIRADAVRLSWQWTNLKAAMREAGITLRLAPREITDDGDLDGPHVGETWTQETKLEGIQS